MEIRLERSGTSWEEATLSGQVLAGSIDTGMGLRDKHLRRADYFGVEDYPLIRMESTALRKTQKDRLEGTFRLTMKGETREIPLVFTFTESKGKLTLQTAFELDRREFGIGGRSLILSDRVRIFVSAAFATLGGP